MPEHFERVHRELREAEEAVRGTWLGGQSDVSDLVAACRLLDWYEARTGPLVDDLVAAVREVEAAADRVRSRMTAGVPRGEAVDGLLHEIAFVSVSLAALDEEAGRGR